MNKKLVALAVAGALASPLAAQAQTANVTLYGRLNLDLEFVKGDQGGSNPTVNRVSSNSSRFGLRGTENIGGGLNAIFQIEQNVSGDTGNSSASGIASRETFVGLQGGWGTFQMGKFLTPYDDLHPIFGNAPTLTTTIFSTAAIWANGNNNKAANGFDARLGNSLRYNTPNIAGFTGEFQYSTRDSSGNTTQTPNGGDNGDHASELRHANVISVGGFYNNGPLNVGLAYERNNKVRGADLNDDAFSIAGAFDLGTIMGGFGLRLGAVYEKLKYETPTGDVKRDFWGVSATVPAGSGRFYGFYGQSGDGKGSAVDGTVVGTGLFNNPAVGDVVKGPNTKGKQWEISYSYNLSKRTMLYGGYVKIINAEKARYSFNINSYSIATGGDPGAVVLGMVHFF
jgi:predicted porin